MQTLLGSIPSPSSGNLGPFHMYGLILAAGVLVAVWFAEHRWRRRGYPRDGIYDISFWVVIWGVIGARLYHVITDYQTAGKQLVKDIAYANLEYGANQYFIKPYVKGGGGNALGRAVEIRHGDEQRRRVLPDFHLLVVVERGAPREAWSANLPAGVVHLHQGVSDAKAARPARPVGSGDSRCPWQLDHTVGNPLRDHRSSPQGSAPFGSAGQSRGVSVNEKG